MTNGYSEVPVLDQTVVDELRESVGGDDDFVRELVATYVEEARTHVDGMTDAATAGDSAAIVRPAHTLKSTSASIGAMRLSAICRDIEAGRVKSMLIPAMADHLRRESIKFVDELKRAV